MNTPRPLLIAILLACCTCLVLGYQLGRQSHQNVNELITAGFHVYDEDNYECSQFDEGLFTLLPTYFTIQDKPHSPEDTHASPAAH